MEMGFRKITVRIVSDFDADRLHLHPPVKLRLSTIQTTVMFIFYVFRPTQKPPGSPPRQEKASEAAQKRQGPSLSKRLSI